MSLLPISRIIANGALRLGGSTILWYKAQTCPAYRADGTPCFDSKRGGNWVDCAVCNGTGMAYTSKPRPVLGIYTDNSNEFLPDGNGGFLQGKKTLSLPHDLDIKLLKPKAHANGTAAQREFLRDKFVILSPEGKHAETVYLDKDPVKPTINSGYIYQICEVANNS